MSKSSTFRFLAVFTLMLSAGVGFAQPVAPRVSDSPVVALALTHNQKLLQRWMTGTWSDDALYAKIRRLVEYDNKIGKLNLLIEKFSASYANTPDDPKVAFEYLYSLSVNEFYNDIPRTDLQRVQSDQFVVWMEVAKFPPTYNYIRLTLMCDTYWGQIPGLIPVLQGFCDRDPTDVYVQYRLAGEMSNMSDDLDQSQAVQIADGLTAKYPKIVQLYTMQGYTNYRRWLTTKNQFFQQQAIAAYQNYLKYAKPNGCFVKTAKTYLTMMQQPA